ncbi:hypothetical protein WJX79_003353 [Trebouxia sp. C0005]
MGADETALLLPHGTASKSDLSVPVAFDETPNTWTGSLISCCAGCDSTGWGSCLFSYFVPCVAFGQNMKRALNLSTISQAVIYVLLFLTGRALYLWSSQAVHAACPRPHHGHYGHHGQHGHHGHHNHTGLEPLHTVPLPGSFNDTEMGDNHHMSPSPMTTECHQAMAAMGATYCLMVLLAIVGIVYAARRRTQIRERFGIAGSRMGDFCAWCWCAPCALCQETRTIWSNSVFDGVWNAQTPVVSTDASYSVPAVDDMKVDYKPVDAKEYV